MMGLWKTLTGLFKKKDRFQNKRTFQELARLYEMPEALEMKQMLEDHEIPVYLLDLRNIGSQNKSYIAIRVPGKFMSMAKDLIKKNE